MNKITLSHHTVLWCIRELRENPKNSQLINIANQKLLSARHHDSPKMHILVLNQNDKHCNSAFKFHLQTKPLPRNSINKITENISIVCPELMLIQLARTLPYEQLFLVALELCGTYTLCTQNGNFASDIPAITTPENLQSAESTYRDADMAKEMTEFTKNNILMQAATAMLSQANEQNQNVLSLLQ